ncbi:MAG: MFS transporter [Mycobacteriales bacterium]
MFRSLKVRNYRLYATGQVVSLTGSWLQTTAQSWLVLELSHGSGVALGIVTALQFLPILFFGLIGGVIADRHSKRRLLMITQSTLAALALAQGVLTVTGVVQLWHVYLLAFGLGVVNAVDNPTRQAFVSEMVGADNLVNAVALNSATFNSARLVGPAVAGVLIGQIGTGWVFLLNAVSFVAVIGGIAMMRESELTLGRRAARGPGEALAGLRYVVSRQDLLIPMIMVGFVGAIGLNFPVTIPLMVREVFGRGAVAYGFVSTMLAVGTLSGALIATRRTARPPLRLLFAAAATFGVLEVVTSAMPLYTLFWLMLVPTGAAVITFNTAANASVQLGAEPHVRGRVMALYVLVFVGGAPLGSLLVGWIAEAFSPRWSLAFSGSVTVLVAAVLALYTARRGGRHLIPPTLTMRQARAMLPERFRREETSREPAPVAEAS